MCAILIFLGEMGRKNEGNRSERSEEGGGKRESYFSITVDHQMAEEGQETRDERNPKFDGIPNEKEDWEGKKGNQRGSQENASPPFSLPPSQ
jgi:hypothetical protein